MLARGFFPDARLYLRPLGLVPGALAEAAAEPGSLLKLGGTGPAFSAVEVTIRAQGHISRWVLPATEIEPWAEDQDELFAARIAEWLARISAPRASFAGLSLARPLVMGVVNVTPDSFSDGGLCPDPDSAIARGRRLLAEGADIVDVGGESTRPRSRPVPAAEQCARVLPVIRALAEAGAVVSVDTRSADVMTRALEAGARIVNDVSALTGDAASLRAAAGAEGVVLMHMQGTPETMQDDPRYEDAPLDVFDVLAARVEACEAAGIPRARLAVDPGIGFGKTLEHNRDILTRLPLFHSLGCPLVLGVSRKSFIAKLSAGEPAGERLPGSIAAALWGVANGVHILRVHDVAATRQALAVWRGLEE